MFSPVNLNGSGSFSVPESYKEHARLQVNKKLKYGSSPLATSSFTNSDLFINNDHLNSRKLKMKKLSSSLFPKSSKLSEIPENDLSEAQEHDVEMSSSTDTTLVDDDDACSVSSSSTIVPNHVSKSNRLSSSGINTLSKNIVPSYNSDNISLLTTQSSIPASESLFSVISGNSSPSVVSSFSSSPIMITLSEALPQSFENFYLLHSGDKVLPNGRPSYTQRDLIDWQVNDLRSLLIVSHLRPEWNFQIPIIYSPPGFRVIYLPLDSSEETIAQTLVASDLYIEKIKDVNFRYNVAKNTVRIAKSVKHPSTSSKRNHLQEYEFRNIIDNYMLNLAIESQCQYEYKKTVSSLKKQRKSLTPQQLLKLHKSTGSAIAGQSGSKSDGSLLKKVLINGLLSNNIAKDNMVATNVKENDKSKLKKLISKEELNIIWSQVQNNVYKRAGLNWTPDKV